MWQNEIQYHCVWRTWHWFNHVFTDIIQLVMKHENYVTKYQINWTILKQIKPMICCSCHSLNIKSTVTARGESPGGVATFEVFGQKLKVGVPELQIDLKLWVTGNRNRCEKPICQKQTADETISWWSLSSTDVVKYIGTRQDRHSVDTYPNYNLSILSLKRSMHIISTSPWPMVIRQVSFSRKTWSYSQMNNKMVRMTFNYPQEVSYTIILHLVNSICDKSQQQVPYIYFWEHEIFALSKRQLNELSDDNKLMKIELLLFKL